VAELVEALGRPALHAKSLGFTHPITGERLQFTSDLPPDFQVHVASHPLTQSAPVCPAVQRAVARSALAGQSWLRVVGACAAANSS
jgi:hypothetical protein